MQLRYDPIKKRWVVFAPERGERGDYLILQKEVEDDPEYCPFCPGHESYTGRSLHEDTGIIDGKKVWLTRVIPNKFPLLKVEETDGIKQYGPYAYSSRLGAHEVIIDSRTHGLKIFDYQMDDFIRLFNAVIVRISDLRKDVRLKYITMIKNCGKVAGATLSHPHSQIVAFPFLPNEVKNIWKNLYEYYYVNNRCLVCDILNFELEKKERIIVKNDFFVAYSPYAPRHSFEVHVVPVIHTNDFIGLKDYEKVKLAEVMIDVLKRYNVALDGASLNINLINTACNIDIPELEFSKYKERFFHWYIELIPRINRIGGIEKGTGVYVNPFLPEKCTEILSGINII
ncbi:galactose-1-phosphate uridylyltransferase [Calditerrivibrio nitroreducens]|uniref:UDP-glucose--hexose-1-phosphateuridylyltransfera se n=1 Tax=Calditerrivibrio nitroreducens (strain DSM 19672 / NBRC 101217 / Yu37-1) TaxID=768670 RepID=E4TFH7_CALNY|nr:DUF4931 domain-containing protein [Calditerrivibrio nitroreducens]ADR19550.1 UDP-glucose--hexose-1-phosphateuridylyltransfera se [Calditerrivibrio nitroreducens DSM 19672]